MSIKKSAWWILRNSGASPLLLRWHPKSALLEEGWFRSVRSKESINGDGNPIPWWTYSIIDFLDERLDRSMRILEFGCGNSTQWLANRVQQIVSIENNENWAKKVSSNLPANADILLVDSLEDFSKEIPDKYGDFDVLIIDAGNRMACAQAAINRVTDTGIIIWDNTSGPDWEEIKQFFLQKGYREISFSGMTPQEVALSRTTIFYKSENCLGI